MCQADITPCFDHSIVFPDVDAATLARESAASLVSPASPWQAYLRKVLPPVPQPPRHALLREVRF